MHQAVLCHHGIGARSAIDIAAPPEHVAEVYRDVERWGQTFPATIEHARVLKSDGNWQQIEVLHKLEGRVPNTLIVLSDTEIRLQEKKRLFEATFLNRFERLPHGGTQYIISADICLTGMLKFIAPLLRSYVRRRALKQMNDYVLKPLKAAAEQPHV